MEVQIKITREQHEFLLERMGSDEAIREWMQSCLDSELRKMAKGLRSKSSASIVLAP